MDEAEIERWEQENEEILNANSSLAFDTFSSPAHNKPSSVASPIVSHLGRTTAESLPAKSGRTPVPQPLARQPILMPSSSPCFQPLSSNADDDDDAATSVLLPRKRGLNDGANAFERLAKRIAADKAPAVSKNSALGKFNALASSPLRAPLSDGPEPEDEVDFGFDGFESDGGRVETRMISDIHPQVLEPAPEPLGKYAREPENGMYKTAKASNGTTFYLPFDKFKMHRRRLDLSRLERRQLLPVSVYKLMDEIDSERLTATIEKSRQTLDALNTKVTVAADSEDEFGNSLRDSQMWVDKYRPVRYVDLLTDEWLNVQTISWLKHWDQCVFKRPVPPHILEKERAVPFAQQNQKNYSQVSRQPQQKTGGGFKYNKGGMNNRKKDVLDRPEKRILMLAGAPGLGKTTLAHVIARQCGYNVVEINASDERSGPAVQERIKNALQTKRAIGGDQTPNCVILDEIDGAQGGGERSLVGFLVSMLRSDLAASSGATAAKRARKAERDDSDFDDEDATQTGKLQVKKGKGKKKQQRLLRPIICICNDPYAPALKPLRPYCQFYTVRSPTTQSLERRLQTICDREGVRVEKRALTWWVEQTQGDFRSCLHGLEFMWKKLRAMQAQSQNSIKRKKPTLTLETMKRLDIGRKDQHTSIFKIWEKIFIQPTGKEIGWKKEEYLTPLIQLVQSNGEYDFIMEGCFEFYTATGFRDVHGWGSNMIGVHEYLVLFDMLNKNMFSSASMGEVVKFMPYCIVAMRHYCSASLVQVSKAFASEETGDRRRFPFPRQAIEFRKQSRHLGNLMDGVMHHLKPQMRLLVTNQRVLTEDVLPWVYYLLGLDIRAVNVQLLKDTEKKALERVASLMYAFGLTYTQHKTETGQYLFSLDPPLETVVTYEPTMPRRKILPGGYGIRQMIAREIELETIRQEDSLLVKRGGVPLDKSSAAAHQLKDQSKKLAAAIKTEKLVPRDFFGRPIEVKPEQVERARQNALMLVYKFHEGYSNAVRRKMIIADLIYATKPSL